MSTYHSLHFHVVFATKHRTPWIKDDWLARLHQYMGGTLNGLEVKPLKIGGVADHVHLLMGTNTTHRISDVIRELKKSATQWVHHEIGFAPFGWQDGYSVFSVSPKACERVAAYIAHQAEHHRQRNFREELIEMLDQAGVSYDPKYLE